MELEEGEIWSDNDNDLDNPQLLATGKIVEKKLTPFNPTAMHFAEDEDDYAINVRGASPPPAFSYSYCEFGAMPKMFPNIGIRRKPFWKHRPQFGKGKKFGGKPMRRFKNRVWRKDMTNNAKIESDLKTLPTARLPQHPQVQPSVGPNIWHLFTMYTIFLTPPKVLYDNVTPINSCDDHWSDDDDKLVIDTDMTESNNNTQQDDMERG